MHHYVINVLNYRTVDFRILWNVKLCRDDVYFVYFLAASEDIEGMAIALGCDVYVNTKGVFAVFAPLCTRVRVYLSPSV
jgi:hypothetical protein